MDELTKSLFRHVLAGDGSDEGTVLLAVQMALVGRHYERIAERASLVDRIFSRAPSYLRFIQDKPSWILMFLFGRTLVVRRFDRKLRARYAAPAPVPAPAG